MAFVLGMEANCFKSSLTYNAGKSEEERKNQRKRNLLLLVYDFLKRNGYMNSANSLRSEVGFDVDDYEMCDNVNLDIVLQDFESYYFLKYQTHVQFSKKLEGSRKPKGTAVKKFRHRLAVPGSRQLSLQKDLLNFRHSKIQPISGGNGDGNLGKMMQPLGPYASLDAGNEWRVLAETVCQEILMENPDVYWDEVVGHDSVKEALKEALVYPAKYPDLYNIVNPWRGMLLYGPTGTGKTMLAKAAATECNATFFNLSPAVLTSKWRGESEKIVKVLFDLAVEHSPSVIFLDEVDSLISQRVSQEHEASRRFKSELLARIEGFASQNEAVFVLSASNFPWEVDASMLRRLEKRIYIPLPSKENRTTMLKMFLPPRIESSHVTIKTKIGYDEIGELTEGYSGADLQLLAKEVKMSCIRRAIKQMESSDSSAQKCSDKFALPSVETNDVVDALLKIKPAHLSLLKKYEEFTSSSGSY